MIAGRPLSGDVSATGDPCGAIATDIVLGRGEGREIVFILGDAPSLDAARTLAARHRSPDIKAALAEVGAEWDAFLGVLQVETPDPAFDIMVNSWLPYQTLSCRLRARTAFYQASGAFGFRDQLQDTLALLLQNPGLARRQIIAAAGRQFEQGDVQHWWLPANGAGVRTMISDDIVWLAYAVQLYVTTTGETALLDERCGYLSGAALEPGQHDAFFIPGASPETGSIFEHAFAPLISPSRVPAPMASASSSAATGTMAWTGLE